ncbi:DUF1552 domain-containing protein [Rhodopirellula sp. MGV]|uniref:DUF1552 domain-containing protein n=1 Tax=Rhodopirellula sp. MGV TaxID=2023130 RepID=UPI000B972AB1|nr:DUF1552 domain-containing protein [Rhodopirellula sp. MGV]OYP34350.1 hypothetical protein CGZ80_14905 [Rhodopirellula sp. MGV]PNY35248.1 DUF1552 domain-containing protein [Rhodopirellula baltica]
MKSLSRRTMLRGTGVALALPFLEAMRPSARAMGAATNECPTRFAALFFPNGVREDRWTPTETGFDWTPPSQLEPIRDAKNDVSVISGLWHQAADTGGGHYVKDAGWLTGTTITKTTGVDLNSNGVSMDQIAAQRLGNLTPLPSLELGNEQVRSGVDGVTGYTRVYGAHIAWRQPTQPLAKEINPRLVFDRMTLIASGKQSGRSNRPILDMVREDASRLRGRLGQHDRQRLEQYLDSVKSLEDRLEAMEGNSGRRWGSRVDFSTRPAPADNPEAHAERTRLMLDMIALAFEADITRVATYMFGNSVSEVNFSFLDDVEGSHHELSHHGNKTEKLDQYERITTWHVAQFAYLIEKLRSIPEGDSNVLANSAILFGSGFRDGNAHNPHDLPVLLAGQGGGALRSGQHIACTKDNPMSNLLLSMLHVLGVNESSFADSTGVIDSLFV